MRLLPPSSRSFHSRHEELMMGQREVFEGLNELTKINNEQTATMINSIFENMQVQNIHTNIDELLKNQKEVLEYLGQLLREKNELNNEQTVAKLLSIIKNMPMQNLSNYEVDNQASLLMKKFNIVFSEENYRVYMGNWLNGDGILQEITFWERVAIQEGPLVSFERDFIHSEEVLPEYINCLDVGCGLYTSCGSIVGDRSLEVTAVDPLGDIYSSINDKYGITTKIKPRFGMVEHLSDQFKKNSFDIVHMRNALDHSFNPILGILQMLYVCRVGGKVILIHRDNEAEKGQNTGFHQWNMTLKNGQFIIWRDNIEININQELAEYVNVTFDPNAPQVAAYSVTHNPSKEPGMEWNVWNKVVLTKHKDIPLIKDPFAYIFADIAFKRLLDMNMNEFYSIILKEAEKKITWNKLKITNGTEDMIKTANSKHINWEALTDNDIPFLRGHWV